MICFAMVIALLIGIAKPMSWPVAPAPRGSGPMAMKVEIFSDYV
jgi:hypothetical protein